MLIQQGSGRSEAIDLRLACTLAGVAGSLNAAAFYAVGFFSANMTGNVSTLSVDAATGHWQKGLFYLTILLAFVTGAGISTTIINAGQRRDMSRIYALTVLLEAVLLIILGGADLWLSGQWRVPTVVLGLSFIMGLQNAMITKLSGAEIRTTHMTGIVTDIGIELGKLFYWNSSRGGPAEPVVLANRAKLKVHGTMLVMFFVGGVTGALGFKHIGYAATIPLAGLLIVLAIVPLIDDLRDQVYRLDR